MLSLVIGFCSFTVQRWPWWRGNYARGGAKRSRGFAGTLATATASAGTRKVRGMERAMLSFPDWCAFVTSTVD